MSTETQPPPPPSPLPTGFPELTELGKRIEVLRIQRGLSKQHLARGVGTSRQQLWRVSTGKSELTPALRQRLADALGVDASVLREPRASRTDAARTPVRGGPASAGEASSAQLLAGTSRARVAGPVQQADELGEFVRASRRISAALALLPGGPDGRRLKRALLDAIEDVALERGIPLGPELFELRRRVLSGEL